MAFKPRDPTANIPSPPRLEGDWAKDAMALRDWLAQFFYAAVLQSGLLDPAYQASGADDIDENNLPDPAATTIARAQETANLAVHLIASTWAARLPARGTFTIEGTADAASVAFGKDIGTTDYDVLITPQTYEGSPSVDAFRIIKITNGTAGFAVEVTAAPGSGTSITFAYIVIGDF